MLSFVSDVISHTEPLDDVNHGPLYRCALTLKDGTYLPCAVLQSRERYVALAKRRIREELAGKGGLLAGADPFGEIVATFTTSGNRIADYEVASATPSPFAPPKALMAQIRGETTMGWTAWVFRMKDGRAFSYGTSYRMDFLPLPDGYGFSDVTEVINHAFVDPRGGVIRNFAQGGFFPKNYPMETVLKSRSSFTCFVDGI